ncbi:MAG: hypothetical protein RIQ52_1445 [Pseudomonadota bacterium]
MPLVVDLDGTLLQTDMLHESALQVFGRNPPGILQWPLWLRQGKAVLKHELARRASFDAAILPYRHDFLEWLRLQQKKGRRLVLATASDISIARAVADYLGIFDEVIASDRQRNMAGRNKAEELCRRYGERGFDYAGNASPDLEVWKHARGAILVGAPAGLLEQARDLCAIEKRFERPPVKWNTLPRLLRVHQWLKNALLALPALGAHELADASVCGQLLLAFIAFSLCASSVYLANDLLDLASDRAHPRKRLRPFASGQVAVATGTLLIPMLLLLSGVFAVQLDTAFSLWLTIYFLLTCAYTVWLKRIVLVDCLTLALLYTLRVVAGAAAVGLSLSFWLLAFSCFLFLSLAFIKRYAELRDQDTDSNQQLHGRGYFPSDASMVEMMGISSGFSAVLVLALYLNSDAVMRLYHAPELVWGAVPVMLFWVSWMWLQAHRGLMHDDPLVFAVKDRASWAAGMAFAAVMLLGSLGLSWPV